jgi:serine/threonine-protein kinase ATR
VIPRDNADTYLKCGLSLGGTYPLEKSKPGFDPYEKDDGHDHMASGSHGQAGPQGHPSFAYGPTNAGPPPSTLAAQLVENIPASARHSRPDETAELKRLFNIIEEVKDRPELLETQEERVEHNHMLIYVYARVALEGVELDDPVTDRTRMHAEILKAINFMRVTIKETPGVLKYNTDGGSFLFRGQEPLWAWVLPKLLRMLGHPRSLALQSEIERFCEFLLQTACQSGILWDLVSPLGTYYRQIVRGKDFLESFAYWAALTCGDQQYWTVSRERNELEQMCR